MGEQAPNKAGNGAGSVTVGLPDWRPIETAPPRELLLYFPAKLVGAYAQSTLPQMLKVGRASDYPNRTPSHWMPLPGPPK